MHRDKKQDHGPSNPMQLVTIRQKRRCERVR